MIRLNAIINKLTQKKGRIKSDKLINNIFWNSIARFGSAGINFLMTLFLMSVLNVADYGEFVVYFAIYSTIPLFFDFGLNNSLVSLGARLKSEDIVGYKKLISTHFSIKAILFFLVAAVALPLMIFGIWQKTILVIILLAAPLAMWEYFLGIFKARQDFKLLSQLIPIRNFLAFSGVLLLHYFFDKNTWHEYLYVIILIPLLMSIGIYLKFFSDLKFTIDKHLLKKTVTLSKWIALFSIITAVHSKLSIYLLKYFATIDKIAITEVGIFSAAFSLLAITNVLTSTFAEAILPKVSEERNHKYLLEFINRLKRTVPYVILFALIIGIILYFAFTYGFNRKYIESINSMIFIGIGMILTFYIHTLNTVFYPLNRTDFVFKSILVMFFINILFGYVLIPILGAEGAAITHMLVSAAGLFYTYVALIKLLQKYGSLRSN
jgi:O-antigen/teichoic acid export membrane protein